MSLKPYIDPLLVQTAMGKKSADLVLRGGRIVNVYTREVLDGDVAVAGDRIAAVGNVEYCLGPDTVIHEADGAFLVPGLIDPHIHPEVSKLSLTKLAEALVARGTTTIMCSFDQIGVILGIEGIRAALDEMKNTRLRVIYCTPSRLPYTTPASTVAHTFGPEEHKKAFGWDETAGMWEYMIESIAEMEEGVLSPAGELLDKGYLPQGHLPFTSGPLLMGAVAAGAATDHESWSADQVAEKLRSGIYVLLRKASCVDNIAEGIRAVTELGLPTRRLSFCGDDIDCTDIRDNGHVDHFIRYAVSLGIDPLDAIQMATLTAAEAFRVDHKVGSITPGRSADFLLVENLEQFQAAKVYSQGRLAAENGRAVTETETHESADKSPASNEYPTSFYTTMKLDAPVRAEDIYLTVDTKARSADVQVMYLEPSQLRTKREAELPVQGGKILPSPEKDVLYISVTDRHSGQGKTASAFIGGFGLKTGAFATSLSPDDDNVICVGASVEDMVCCINHLFERGGGQVVAEKGKIVAEIELPLCGIMADVSVDQMAEKETELRNALFHRGVSIPKPFFSVLFLSITAIPEYSITDMGLVEAAGKNIINPIIKWR